MAHRKASGELDFAEFVALKCFSKSRLSKKRDIRKVGGRMAVTTALDKVGVELRVLGGSPAPFAGDDLEAVWGYRMGAGQERLEYAARAN